MQQKTNSEKIPGTADTLELLFNQTATVSQFGTPQIILTFSQHPFQDQM